MDPETIKIIQDANQSIKEGRERLEESINQLSEILPGHPNTGSICSALCHLYLVLEKTDIPTDWLAQGIAYDNDLEDAIIATTTRFYQEGRLNESLELLERFVEIFPDHVEAWNDMGAVLFALNNWTRAKDAFEQALQLDPTYGESILNLTVLYVVTGQPEHAKQIANKALDGSCKATPYILKEIAEVVRKINGDTSKQLQIRAEAKEGETGETT